MVVQQSMFGEKTLLILESTPLALSELNLSLLKFTPQTILLAKLHHLMLSKEKCLSVSLLMDSNSQKIELISGTTTALKSLWLSLQLVQKQEEMKYKSEETTLSLLTLLKVKLTIQTLPIVPLLNSM